MDRRTGKRKSKGAIIGFCILFGVLFLYLAGMFFGMAFMLSSSLVRVSPEEQKIWLYFAIMGLMAIMLGIFGSVFNTYSGLYNAKDNDLLLSMPIKTWKIVFARIAGVSLMSFLFSAIVWIPTIICYWITGTPSVTAVIFEILMIILIPMFVAVFTCALGWVIALVAGKVKKKSFITVIIALVFFALYYLLCFKMSSILEKFIDNSAAAAGKIKKYVYLGYILGKAAEGDVINMLIFTGITLAAFALCCCILARSFIRLVTTNKGTKKKKYKAKEEKAYTPERTLLRREFKRFTSSPTYMLNMGLGVVILPVISVILLVKMNDLNNLIDSASFGNVRDIIVTAVCTVFCMIVSLNCITAPSISLEGKNLWILRSIPVRSSAVLNAKKKMQVLVNGIPSAVCSIIAGIALKAGIVNIILMIASVTAFVFFGAAIGLSINIRKPDLFWTNETIPIKQGISVLLTLLLEWGAVAAVAGICIPLAIFLSSWVALLVMTGAMTGIYFIVNGWNNKTGVKRFEQL